MLTAELITTGAELLNGSVTNGHARVLGDMLGRLGIKLVRDITVVDDASLMADSMVMARRRSKLVFITGGLGPTEDDITCEVLSTVLDRPLEVSKFALDDINRRYPQKHHLGDAGRQKQSTIVSGAEVMPNPVGVAPGQRIVDGDTTIIVLPGPPPEFIALMETAVLSWLAKEYCHGQVPQERVIMLSGMGESEIVRTLKEQAVNLEKVDIAYCASPGRIEFRMTSASEDEERLNEVFNDVVAIFEPHIFATHRSALEETIGQLLIQKGQKVAVAESCTGGLLGGRISAVPGSSGYFSGGIISYSNDVKMALLGVKQKTLEAHGAVSEEVAREMAEGARSVLRTDFGISITGIAGPGGETPDKPVGLVYIALATPNGTEVMRNTFRGNRGMVREFAVQRALGMLWRSLR
jgi:nicotinamide-nucleotide amidase